MDYQSDSIERLLDEAVTLIKSYELEIERENHFHNHHNVLLRILQFRHENLFAMDRQLDRINWLQEKVMVLITYYELELKRKDHKHRHLILGALRAGHSTLALMNNQLDRIDQLQEEVMILITTFELELKREDRLRVRRNQILRILLFQQLPASISSLISELGYLQSELIMYSLRCCEIAKEIFKKQNAIVSLSQGWNKIK